jgi:hypothetical protein
MRISSRLKNAALVVSQFEVTESRNIGHNSWQRAA